MPSKPPLFNPSGKSRQDRERERKAVLDQKRPTAPQRGYDRDWRELRIKFKRAHPVCCAPACGRPTQEIDHVVSVEDAPHLRLDWNNLRPFCKPCHSARTATEQSFGRTGGGTTHPRWLRPSVIPLVIVCGPPASGKSYYVARHAQPRDLVIDLDLIGAKLDGASSPHQWDRRWLDDALRERNNLLGAISRSPCRWSAAWFILSEPRAYLRQWWQDALRPSSMVVCAAPKLLCEQRVIADPDRSGQAIAVGRWWAQYQPRMGEVVVNTG